MPFTIFTLRPWNKVSWETSYFTYIPTGSHGTLQHVLERSKLEYRLTKRFSAGGGYAGYGASGEWDHKPFVSGTYHPWGLEVRVDKIPRDWQVQLRFARSF
jgi:hypothetical protein